MLNLSFSFLRRVVGNIFYSLCRRYDTQKMKESRFEGCFSLCKIFISPFMLHSNWQASHRLAFSTRKNKNLFLFYCLCVGDCFMAKKIYIRTFISTNHPTLVDTHTQFCHTISTAIATFTALSFLKIKKTIFFSVQFHVMKR